MKYLVSEYPEKAGTTATVHNEKGDLVDTYPFLTKVELKQLYSQINNGTYKPRGK